MEVEYLGLGNGDATYFQQRAVLRAFYNVVFYESDLNPCILHFRRVCRLIGINYDEPGVDVTTRLARIYQVTEEDSNFYRAYLDQQTRRWFVPNNRSFNIQAKYLNRNTYRPAHITPKVGPFSAKDKYVKHLNQDGIISRPGFYEWVVKHEIKELLVEEIAMLQWHCRDGADSDGGLGNAYYTIAAQLMYADPLLWLIHHRISLESEVHLIAYPKPLLSFAPGDITSSIWAGEVDLVQTNKVLSCVACLDGENRDLSTWAPTSRYREALVSMPISICLHIPIC